MKVICSLILFHNSVQNMVIMSPFVLNIHTYLYPAKLIDISAKWTGNAFVKFVFLLIEGQQKRNKHWGSHVFNQGKQKVSCFSVPSRCLVLSLEPCPSEALSSLGPGRGAAPCGWQRPQGVEMHQLNPLFCHKTSEAVSEPC